MRRLARVLALAGVAALAAGHAGAQMAPPQPPAPAPAMPSMPSEPGAPVPPRASAPSTTGRPGAAKPGVQTKAPPAPASERFSSALNLNDKQKAEWDAAEREAKAIVSPLMIQLRGAQRQLDTAVKQGQSDEVVKERSDALAAIQSEMRRARTEMESRMTAVLTPEQRRKYEIITRR